MLDLHVHMWLLFIVLTLQLSLGAEPGATEQSYASLAAAAGARLTHEAAAAGFGSSDPPPGTFVSQDALDAFEQSVRARAAGDADGSPPDKLEDQWTISKAFRDDLRMHFEGTGENFTVLEVGSYLGYTTRLLSQLFTKVITLDANPHLLSANHAFNVDRPNILYLKFHSVESDWSLFATNTIHVVFLDASHDLVAVISDIENCLRHPTVSLIVFDDYGAETGVRDAVHAFVSRGLLKPVAYLGEKGGSKPWRVKDGREISEPEGIACEVVRVKPDVA